MKITASLSLVALLFAPLAAFAAGGDALKIPVSPRAVALGGASGALANDVNALTYNPAGLATIPDIEVALAHRIGTIDATEYVALARSMKIGGVFGASVMYSYLPEINNAGATDPAVNANDMLISLAYATLVPTGVQESKELSAGVNLKWLRSVLGAYAATSVAVDLGLRWQPQSLKAMQVGLALQNLGLPLKFVDESDSLPLTLKAATSYLLLSDESNTLNLALDLDAPLADKDFALGGGAEYWYSQMIALRLGYRYQGDSLAGGPVGGLGVRFTAGAVAVRLDYAFKPVYYSSQTVEPEHYLALTLGF
jgi:hypothetical protein